MVLDSTKQDKKKNSNYNKCCLSQQTSHQNEIKWQIPLCLLLWPVGGYSSAIKSQGFIELDALIDRQYEHYVAYCDCVSLTAIYSLELFKLSVKDVENINYLVYLFTPFYPILFSILPAITFSTYTQIVERS